MIADPVRFNKTIARFDAVNAEDPRKEIIAGVEYPKELLYARRMTAWLSMLAPEASEVLQLATRSQHIRRWVIPRREYPMDRQGYKQWRMTLAKFHGETAGKILREEGHAEDTIHRVQALLRKQSLKLDPEAQLLEDVACLVFLENYFADFSKQHDKKKLIGILRKTWKKMSSRGREAALALPLAPNVRVLLQEALEDSKSACLPD